MNDTPNLSEGESIIDVSSPHSPDHMLTFEELVFKGYDNESDINKNDSFSVRGCPSIVFGSIDSLLYDTDNPRLTYMSDVSRYATILGASIIKHSDKIDRIVTRKRQMAREVKDNYSMFSLNLVTPIQYLSPLDKSKKSHIETVHWVKSFAQSTCRYFGFNMSQFGVYFLIEGLCTAKIQNKFFKDGLHEERKMFWRHIDQILLQIDH